MTAPKISITFHEIKPTEASALLASFENNDAAAVEAVTAAVETVTSAVETVTDTPSNTAQEWPQLNENGILVDSLGLPWSNKINTDSKLCVKKTGEWKVIRKTPPEIIEQVRNELRAAMNAPVETVAAPVETLKRRNQ